MFLIRVALAVLVVACSFARAAEGPAREAPAGAADLVWLEGESPANASPALSAMGAGRPQFLSSGRWLAFTADANEIEKKVPAEGLIASYRFDLPQAGLRQVWARIGYEFARAPFDWRLDNGDWKTVKPDEVTTDLMELSFFTEVAWLKLGEVNLPTGAHQLDVRLPRHRNAKGEFQRTLFALDALCLSASPFFPHGPHKPADAWRTSRDEQAERHVFQLPEPLTGAGRSAVKLAGLWEVCRHDEALPGEVAAPIRDFPAHPFWSAIDVPGDKNAQREDLIFAHRLWYRTRVNIPASHAGRSFFLVFPVNSLNTTVYVNDVYCGFDKNPFARIQMDISAAVRPGQVNEIRVGIRDNWYARRADPKDPMVLRRTFNLPMRFFESGFQDLVYPVWMQKEMGILGTPQLVSAGQVYASDVFAIPSVQEKRLGVEATLKNSSKAPIAGEMLTEAVNDRTGQVEFTAPPRAFSLEAGQEQIVAHAAPWANPRLWWPDDPSLYRLRTTLKSGGRILDVQETPFGFREWSIDGIHFRLNGVKWQGFSEHGIPGINGGSPATLIAAMHDPKYHYGFARARLFSFRWLGLETPEALAEMDRGGVIIRRSGYCDGMAIGYNPPILPELGRNWIDHLKAWVRGERNHPSIMIWSLENEMNYINARNMGQLDAWEPVLARAYDAVRSVDPTRPVMVDGGGATRSQALPVHGDHYSTKPFWNYPQLAYEANENQSPWTRDWKRPVFIGEELFAAGINPAYAYFGGESVFLGKEGNRPAVGKAMQVISQGYRWFGIAACDFCQGPSDADGSQYNGWSPRAALVRQWDWTFGSGQKAKRTIGIFNNTRLADPLTFAWTLTVGGRDIESRSSIHRIPPGESEKFDLELSLPSVTAREEGELRLTLSAGGKEIFRDVKAVSVLPPPAIVKTSADRLFVYDPRESVVSALQSVGIPFTRLDSLAAPPRPGCVWLVGRDALKVEDSTTSAFAAYALGGGRVIVLEQSNPLRFQGLNPAVAEASSNVGRTAFLENPTHPVLRNLADKDFFTWEPGEVVYRNAYIKPSRGATSLIQCNEALSHSALMVVPVGPGVVVLNQTVLTEKLAENVAARTLLHNLLDYAHAYQLEQLPTTACVEPPLAAVLDSINLQYSRAETPLAAIQRGRIAIISATPANLRILAQNIASVRAFTEGGGRLVLHGLTPDGLADYNTVVGYEHMIRPFRREKVSLASPRHPLLSGAGLSDVALYSAQRVFNFQEGNYVASDAYSFVVDLDEVAPFATPANGFHYNLVNGMVSADGWPYIVNESADASVYVFTLPRRQEIVSWTWVGNVFYDRTSRVSVTPDDDPSRKQFFNVPEASEAVSFDFNPPMTATRLTVRHEAHTDIPDKKQNGKTILGCDNIRFIARRPADFRQRVRPMLNVGALVEYPRGAGGIVLCNVLFKDREDVPVNATKKRTVLTALLRNLKAPFAGKTVIAGAALDYAPIDLSSKANQYRTERGWFGDAKHTFKDLPVGEQRFAGVRFNVFEFATSPVPTAVMLAGPNIPNNLPETVRGIAVGRKADALFFLQAARIDKPRTPEEKKGNTPVELARYVVHYADGKTEEVPVVIDQTVAHYRQASALPLPGAQIGWSAPFAGSAEFAVAYVQQWNNPRPDVEVRSVDLVYPPSRRGVPALLALTAASAP